MAQSRQRTFGPLFYTTLAVGILVLIPFGAWNASERYQDWRAIRQLDGQIAWLGSAVRNPDAEARGQAVAGIRHFIGEQQLSPERRSRIIATLRPLLDDPATWVRVEAAQALARFGEKAEARSRLVGILDDKDPEVRYAAVKALQGISGPNDPDVVRGLMALFADPEGATNRQMLLEDLMRAGEGVSDVAADVLTKQIAQGESIERHEALELLLQIGDRAEGVTATLRGLLGDEDPQLRRLAAVEIIRREGQEAPPDTFTILLGTVIDPAQVLDDRMNALGILREVSPDALAKASTDLVRQLGDPGQGTRQAAHELLSQIIYDIPAVLPCGER